MDVMERYRSGPYELEIVREDWAEEPDWSFIGEKMENRHACDTFRDLFGEGGQHVVFAVWQSNSGALTWTAWRRGEQPMDGGCWTKRPPDWFYFVPVYRVLREYSGRKRRSALWHARQCLAAELRAWSAYYTGDVFGYQVSGPDVQDSCWGHYGATEFPYMQQCAADAAGVPAESWVLVYE